MSKRFNSEIYLDEFAFSNAVPVEHNTLGPGSIAHILRNRTVVASTGVATDRWFHYDQVGSVMNETNSSAALVQTHFQDAFGNVQASWSTGLIGGVQDGWHHNTKARDGFEMVYMYSRWSFPELSLFASKSRFSIDLEHPWGQFGNSPSDAVDPSGRIPSLVNLLAGPASCDDITSIISWSSDWVSWVSVYPVTGTQRQKDAYRNGLLHCLWQCTLAKKCGRSLAESLAGAHELEDPDRFGSHFPDHVNDVHNNQVGRQLAIGCKSTANCYGACKQAIKDGTIYTTYPNVDQ